MLAGAPLRKAPLVLKLTVPPVARATKPVSSPLPLAVTSSRPIVSPAMSNWLARRLPAIDGRESTSLAVISTCADPTRVV